ncbi:MAG: membrane protein insertion efficiency factor YidD [Chlamydiales bacterium]|nr:membrane protein insertion efficiency factor YidD [Chlamydiales bacterium]
MQKKLTIITLLVSIPKYAAVLVINIYKTMFSPLLGKHCRFYPSCSDFAIEVIKNHGFIKGSILTITRLFKCFPWHPGGYDPAPQSFLQYFCFKKDRSS